MYKWGLASGARPGTGAPGFGAMCSGAGPAMGVWPDPGFKGNEGSLELPGCENPAAPAE